MQIKSEMNFKILTEVIDFCLLLHTTQHVELFANLTNVRQSNLIISHFN